MIINVSDIINSHKNAKELKKIQKTRFNQNLLKALFFSAANFIDKKYALQYNICAILRQF